MLTYLATFTYGLSEIAEIGLNRFLQNYKVILVQPDHIIFETSESIDKVRSLPFLNSVFILLFQNNRNLHSLINNLGNVNLKSIIYKKTFRIYFSIDTQTVSKPNFQTIAEDFFLTKTKMKIHRTLPETEFWFIEKSGHSYIAQKISKKQDYQDKNAKGQLREELCVMMNLLADLKRTDKVLDPFAGSGAITEATYKYFKVQSIASFDLRNGVQEDFFKLDERQKFEKIITDPPWGEEQKLGNIGVFYTRLFGKAAKLLSGNGSLVLLTSFEVMHFPAEFEKVKEYNLSVSGKKAKLYKFIKK